MQREFTENFNKLCQCVTQAITDVGELNVNLLNRMTKGNANPLEDLGQMRKPEDYISAQIKFISNAHLELLKYTQDLGQIWLENAQEIGKLSGDIMRETTANASKAVKTAAAKGKEKVRESV